MVSGTWIFSDMSAEVRKACLRELGLPVRKRLVYRSPVGAISPVADLMIAEIFDGWCTLSVKLAEGTNLDLPVHDSHLAEMNSGTTEADSAAEAVDGMPLDFFVIDLETTGTDYKSAEICEIAALRVEGGLVVDEFEQLVYIDGEMPRAAQFVNHISKEMLEGEPHMTAALSSFLSFIGTSPVLVGHNICGFDIPLLKRVASLCGLRFPPSQEIDTLTLARRAWPDRSSHSMKSLRSDLGIEGRGAHRALKDCQDELEVYMAIRRDVAAGRASIADPDKRRPRWRSFTITASPSTSSAKRPAAAPKNPPKSLPAKWQRRKASEFTTEVTSFDESNPLFGKGVVFSGDVPGHGYDECMQLVKDSGGIPQDRVTKKTGILVVGASAGLAKTEKAKKCLEAGQDIKIIDASEFSRIVGWEKG